MTASVRIAHLAVVSALVTTLSLPAHCPPQGHVPSDGTYYRLTTGDSPLGDEPGLANWRLPIENKKSAAYQQYDDCDAYAHSVFDDIEVLKRAREALSWARKKTISKVDLEPEMGSLAASESDVGPGHYDWWPSPLDRVPPCVVVEGKL